MKIAAASNNKTNLTGHLGKCRGFIIYETEGDKIISREYRENSFTHHRQHEGEDHNHEHNHSHNALVEGLKDCSVLLFNSGGWRVIEDLKSNNIYPFLTDEKIADEAVIKYLKKELREMTVNTCKAH